MSLLRESFDEDGNTTVFQIRCPACDRHHWIPEVRVGMNPTHPWCYFNVTVGPIEGQTVTIVPFSEDPMG